MAGVPHEWEPCTWDPIGNPLSYRCIHCAAEGDIFDAAIEAPCPAFEKPKKKAKPPRARTFPTACYVCDRYAANAGSYACGLCEARINAEFGIPGK